MKKIHCGMERFVRAALGAYIDVKCPAESILSKTGTHRLTAPHTRLVLRIVGIKMLLMIFPFTLQVRLWKELNIQFFHNDSVLPTFLEHRAAMRKKL